MFTFCPGFEAATLKIPNKELSSYGAMQNGGAARGLQSFSGSNDPYNLITANQGGIVVDGARDGLLTSWPATAPFDESHLVPNNVPSQPPRKQIIGFAKFRTRAEAIEARDLLQGRRVDMEKGSILKAEMAKKNLHTKRGPGVGPMGLGNNLMNGIGMDGSDPYNQRERELGIMGIGVGSTLGPRRATLIGDDEAARAGLGFGSFGPRGARERAEEDERERERERKRRDKETMRLRQNSYAFEAFHSVPQQMVREGANSLLQAENGALDANGAAFGVSLQSIGPLDTTPLANGTLERAPWGSLRDVTASAALRKQSMPALSSMSAISASTSLSPENSPPTREAATSPPTESSSSQAGGNISSINPVHFSPQSTSSSLPGQSASANGVPSSPEVEGQIPANSGSIPPSASASVNGSLNGGDVDDQITHGVGVLAVSTSQGSTSPQLPSPASGASSTGSRNPGDHNPPVCVIP